MNNELQNFAKDYLKDNLAKCSVEQRYIFRLMYGYNKPELTINEIVDAMPEDKLDWAMDQVKRTLDNKKGKI